MPFFVKVIFSIFLAIGIVSPRTTWAMTEGWKFRDAEPSDAYLMITRVMSTIILLVLWLAM